jgi:thymidylate synthase (FAD)
MMDPVPVLNHGFVRLDDYMADDLSVVNSARVSFGKRKSILNDADIGVINHMMANKHGTPFEHNSFRFHVKCPIFVMREWIRHRISSFNEFSMRYTEAPAEWYVPDVSAVRYQVGKAGAYNYERANHETASQTVAVINSTCQSAYDAYQGMLQAGIAKEVARAVLPVAMYTEFYWTINARSLMNFLSLRNAPQAQAEIQEYARVIEGMFSDVMPITHRAFVECERRAP